MRSLKDLVEEELAELELPEPVSLFESAILSRGYFPSKTFYFSIVGHAILFATVVVLSVYRGIPEPPSVVEQVVFIDLRVPDVVMLPPMFAPGNQGIDLPAPKPAAPAKKAAGEPAAARTKGLSYPGPQPIISDPPDPTNQIQTVLQPDIKEPEILVPPVPLPNIVQVADVVPVAPKLPEPEPEPEPVRETAPPEAPKPPPTPEPPPPAPEPPPPPEPETPMVLPSLDLAPVVRLEKPKISLPPSIPPLIQAKPSERPAKIELPSLMKAQPLPEPPPEPEKKPVPEAKPVVETKPAEPPPKAAEPENRAPAPAKTGAALPTGEKPMEAPPAPAPETKKDLLSLTPMPASSKTPDKVPAGEARGRFAISPEPNLDVSETEPGAKTGIRAKEIGIGNSDVAPSGNDAAFPNTPVVVTLGKAKPSARTGTGAKQGTAKARGAGAGKGAGTGKGSSKKAFSGITIVGGSVQPGSNPVDPPVVPARRPLQTAYGLSIISTENSGGGLPFFGVFSHEQIYTVYLDMREDEAEKDPSWTLEFAVIPDPAAPAGAAADPARSQQGLILPFPAEKARPALPEDAVRKNLNRMIIVYGIVNKEGELEQISIKDSPDERLNEPVLQALGKWLFRPAQLNGAPVAAKLLLGIPLWLPPEF